MRRWRKSRLRRYFIRVIILVSLIKNSTAGRIQAIIIITSYTHMIDEFVALSKQAEGQGAGGVAIVC